MDLLTFADLLAPWAGLGIALWLLRRFDHPSLPDRLRRHRSPTAR